MQQAGGVVEGDGLALGQQHVAGVQARVHLHDGDARLGIAGLDRAMDGRGAAPARQQRAVDVQAAQARQVQHPLRQDQSIGRDHQHVRAGAVQRGAAGLGFLGELAVQAQAARLRHREAQFQRKLLDRRRAQLHAAPGRAVGLGEHERDSVAGGVDRLQRDRGEFRRSRECHAERGKLPTCRERVDLPTCRERGAESGHQRLRAGCSSRVFLIILVLMRSRLSGLR